MTNQFEVISVFNFTLNNSTSDPLTVQDEVICVVSAFLWSSGRRDFVGLHFYYYYFFVDEYKKNFNKNFRTL